MYHFNYNFRFVASCILTFYLVLCFEESHGNYSYFKKDVVKLVDFVDSIDWINFNDLILDGGAKVAAKTQNQQLLLDRGSSAKLIVKRNFKYLILNYLGTEKHKMFEVTLDENSNCQLYSYSSYNNQIWTCSSNNSYPGVLKVKSVYSKKKLVQRIGISNVTKYKTFGVLQEDGKKRLEEIDAFFKPQLFVAILGLRGSGKSTIASLLSGNHEMFVQERRSTRTTTSGIDISPIISTEEYIPAVNDALKTNFSNIDSHFPLVITDSEGMGVRGDDIDFVSTIPPLLFSNIILWVTTDSLRLDEELTKLDRYLNLANRIQDDSGKLCSSFQGGRLIVIINKMQGDESDKELNDELLGLAPELENIELDSAKPLMQDSETDEEVVDELSILKSELADFESEFAAKTNSIRQKLKKCFKSIQVVGFPYLILPKTEKYLKYTNIKGEGSGRFKQSLIKLISLILKERDQVRVLAGTVVTPKIMINLFQLVLEKINSGAKFLDIDLMDNLFTVNIKQNLTEYEFLFNKRLNEIERTKKIEAGVEAVRSLTDRNKNKLSVLLEQSQNERQIRITMEEWNATEARLTKLMESMMTYRFNATISESHSLLTKLLPICMFLPAKYHHCLGNYFSGRLSSYRRLINLSPLGNKTIIYDTVDLLDKEIDAAFVRCSQQRMIFASAQRAETEKLLQKGIGIIKSVKSVGDKNKAYINFTDLRDNILKKERLTVPSFDMPCHLRDFSEERRGLIDHIDSSFSKGLNRQQNLLSFHKQRTPLEMQLDFSNTLPEIVENGKTVRIFQQSCDLSYILRYILRPHIKELNLICFHVKIDGNTTTQLRKLSIQAVNLNINNKGSTLCLEKPETPSKSKLSQPGQTGYNGGVVLIKVHFKVSGGVLIIEANGGDGGDGGDGIPGSQGADGKNGIIETKYYDKQYYDSLNNTNLIKRESLEGPCSTTGRKFRAKRLVPGPYGNFLRKEEYPEEICSTLTTFDKDFKYTSANAMPGESGSRGSSGGSGGNGGDPGMLRLDIPVRYRKHFSVTAEGGKGGKGGNGGIGGLGGMNGKNKILEATYTRVWESFDKDNLKFKYPNSLLSRLVGGLDRWTWVKSVDAEKAEEQEKYLIKQGWFRSPPEDFYDRFPNRISSSNLVPREKLMEREKNGDIGKSGKKGEDGNKNERKGQTENITLDNFSLFTMFQEINSYSLKETEELSYNGERSMPRMKLYIENMIALAAQQKIGLLNLKAHYETQMIGKSLINVIESEINLTRRLMHDYTARQNFLREDFETYAKELNSIDDKISQFDTGCFKYIVNKLRDRILTESKYQYMKDMKEMKEKLEEERQKTNKLALGILFDIAMISTAFVGNYGGAVSGIHGLTTGLMDLASVKQISNSSDISREYLSRVISNFNITDKLSEELENFAKDVSDTGMKDKIDLGVKFTELMKAYTPVPLASSVISTRLRRHEVRQLISRVKSVIFEVSSILGAKNIPELDSLTSLIDLKVEFTEKVIAVTSEISNIQLKIDEFQRRIEGLNRTSAMTLNNTDSAHYVIDMIVTNAMLNFFSTGKEIYASLYNFMRITAYIRQSNDFFSNIPPFSPLSTSEEFRTALKFISNQINIQSFIHNGEVEIVLDEIDFPNEFEQLRKRRHATFPILNSGKGNTWVKSVKAILTNVSSDGTYYTIAIEHSGSQLFDFDGDLKLNPVVLESTYKNKNTGPEWKMLPKPTYNSIELINYPFSSNYKIRIPENYQTLNIVSNRNINMSSVRQIVLFFEFWEEK